MENFLTIIAIFKKYEMMRPVEYQDTKIIVSKKNVKSLGAITAKKLFIHKFENMWILNLQSTYS